MTRCPKCHCEVKTLPTVPHSDYECRDALLARVQELEAALRNVRDFEPVTNGDYAVMDAIPAMRRIAIVTLSASAETDCEYPPTQSAVIRDNGDPR